MSEGAGGVERIVNVSWSLDLVSLRSHAVADDLLYSVTMMTESGRDVVFSCDPQQLQDLLTKFKEIVRHGRTHARDTDHS